MNEVVNAANAASAATGNVFVQSLIFSCIAFSIVFIVLGGLTLVIFAMRVLTGNSGGGSGSGSGSAPAAAKAAPAAPVVQAAAPAPSGGKSHIAAITAAILALTGGRGRILSVTPASGSYAPGGRVISSEATRTWRTAGIIQSVGRRLAPSWKR